MFEILFNEAKAAQCVAYLLAKHEGSMEVLKLMKLTYLAERRSYELWGEPLLGDVPFSFQHGPVLSKSFDLAKAHSKAKSEAWEALIQPSVDRTVRLKDPAAFDPAKLLALSESEIELLEAIWKEFGRMSGNELRDYTHKNLPEYKEPEPGRRTHIHPVELLRAVGFSEAEAKQQVRSLQAVARVKNAIGSPA